jgi:CHC2 zinc finger
VDKPSILPVVSKYVELRKVGRQYRGLCPFHAERTASFFVDEEKALFYCHSCRTGGDIIRFIELIEQTDFKGALKLLGIGSGEYGPKPIDTRKRRAAAMLATWMNEQHLFVGAMLRELSRNIAIAEEVKATTLVERFEREFSILEILFDDLQRPQYAPELWAARDSVERITGRAPVEPLPTFSPWTPEYAAYLAAHLPALEAAA